MNRTSTRQLALVRQQPQRSAPTRPPRRKKKPARKQRAGRRVRAPASYGLISKNPASPQISSESGGRLRIKHSELVMKVTSGAASTFDAGYSIINPGLPNGIGSVDTGVFTWLRNIARNFQRYKIRSLRFRYEPHCGTSTAGTVAMAVVNDTTDPLPTTLAEMLQISGASAGPAWAPQSISPQSNVLTTQTTNGRLVRSDSLPTGMSYNDFDLGYLVVGTDDTSGAVPCGLVWVDVDVECFLPVMAP